MPAYRAARPVAMTQIVDPQEREERQMIRKSHFLLALALAAAAIGVPVAQATVTGPYKYLGHPTGQAGVDGVGTAAVTGPYKYLGHPTSQAGVDRVSAAAVTSPYKYLGHPTGQAGVAGVATGTQLEAASTSSPQVAGSTGFQWADAGIGAGFMLAIVLILAGAGTGLFISSQNRRQQSVHA